MPTMTERQQRLDDRVREVEGISLRKWVANQRRQRPRPGWDAIAMRLARIDDHAPNGETLRRWYDPKFQNGSS